MSCENQQNRLEIQSDFEDISHEAGEVSKEEKAKKEKERESREKKQDALWKPVNETGKRHAIRSDENSAVFHSLTTG